MPSRTLNRVLWAAVFIVLAALGLTTRADLEVYFAGVGKLDVREEPAGGTVYLRWRGQIDAPMESRLIDAFDRYRGERRKFVLSLSSPGGMIDHGARVVRLLQKIGETNDIDNS